MDVFTKELGATPLKTATFNTRTFTKHLLHQHPLMRF